MKREISFRGKRVFDNKFEYGYLSWHCLGSGINYFINNNVVINETVGQFTGMKDKNGTKIFEGDILNEPFQGREKLYYVFWDEDYFSFRAKSGRVDYYLGDMQKYHCEVVGNIYDNK